MQMSSSPHFSIWQTKECRFVHLRPYPPQDRIFSYFCRWLCFQNVQSPRVRLKGREGSQQKKFLGTSTKRGLQRKAKKQDCEVESREQWGKDESKEGNQSPNKWTEERLQHPTNWVLQAGKRRMAQTEESPRLPKRGVMQEGKRRRVNPQGYQQQHKKQEKSRSLQAQVLQQIRGLITCNSSTSRTYYLPFKFTTRSVS